MAKQLERDLVFFRFPKPLQRKLRTTSIIERFFVKGRHRTRPMVCFINVQSVVRGPHHLLHIQELQAGREKPHSRAFTQAA